MNLTKRMLSAALVVGAFTWAGLASAQTIGAFKTTPITNGIFTFTYIDSTTGLDPTGPVNPAGFPTIGATNLPDSAAVNLTVVEIDGVAFATFEISNLAQLTNLVPTVFQLSYTIELYAGTPDENPNARLDQVSIGANIQTSNPNVLAEKYVFGQDTVVVPDATFQGVMETGSTATGSNIVNCGICRKFVVTDVITLEPVGGTGNGVINSISNDYTVQVIPVPASVALLGAGLFGLGFMRRMNKRG